MLSGIKVLGRGETEKALKENKKEKKHKRKSVHKHHRSSKHEKHKTHKKLSRRDKNNRDLSETQSSDDDDSEVHSEGASPGRAENLAGTGAQEESGWQRENWMTDSTLFSQRLQDAKREKEEEEEKAKEDSRREEEDKKISARELNPFYKDGGSGLPPEAASPGQAAAAPRPAVGDGGASWRMKALKRAREQAAERGIALDEAVAERWGSVADLAKGITGSGRAAHAMSHQHSARDRAREGAPSRRRHGGSEYLADVGGGGAQMRRPGRDVESSWRRPERPPARHRARDEAVWERPPREERGRGRAEAEGRSSGSRADHVGGAGRGAPRGSEDSELLGTVAKSINKFAGDGSFLESFSALGAVDAPPGEAAAEADHADAGASEAGGGRVPERGEGGAPSPQREREEAPAGAGAAPGPSARAPRDASNASAGGSANRSAAEALRARLAGRPAPPAGREAVALPLVDAAGRAAPGAFGRKSAGADALPEGNRIPKRAERYGSDGRKERYFADDDKKSLDDLVREQRYEGAQDIDRNLARNIAKRSRYKGKELDVDDEYDNDGGIDMYEDRARRGHRGAQAQRSKAAQVADYRRMQSTQDRCHFCFGGQARERVKHLTIAIGQTAYLVLPASGRLVPGHCQIVTAEHLPSTRATDDHVWTEIRNFKKCLLQMFRSQGKDVVFLECATSLGSGRGHAAVDCVPVPEDVGADAPIYFKQGLDEAESEWSQHHAKRIIDTGKKGLRGSIPDNFAYFHVEFGLAGGYAHVIDDEQKWNKNFGRDILIGMLGLPEERWHQRARQESLSVQQQWVKQFREQFDPYDWTKQL